MSMNLLSAVCRATGHKKGNSHFVKPFRPHLSSKLIESEIRTNIFLKNTKKGIKKLKFMLISNLVKKLEKCLLKKSYNPKNFMIMS